MPLKKGRRSVGPANVMSSAGGEQAITLAAAQKWGVPPQILWGIYGAESSFGANPGVSSAGAQGPMQFMPATWAKYGGGGDVQSFMLAMPAAAHLLHDLGANLNPNSPLTVTAVNNYNGNRGGASTQTAYWQSVTSLARQWNAAGSTAVQGGTGSSSGNTSGSSSSSGGSSGGSGSSSGGPSLLTILEDLVTFNISDLAAQLALATALGLKDTAIAFSDLVIAPLWHRNQRAVFYYYDVILEQHNAPSGTPAAWQTWAWTAAFWSFGYALLFTNGDKGVLTPSPVRNSRAARHIRRLQAVPAHRSLVKPKDVKGKTPKQPKPKVTSANVLQVGTLTTTRNRPVKVSGTLEGRDYASGTTSDTPVRRVGTATGEVHATGKETRSPFPESHPNHSGRKLSPSTSRGVSKAPARSSRR